VTDLATVSAPDFDELSDREFARVVREGEPPVSITLVEVRAGRPRPEGREPFALTFTGPALLTLDEGIHPLTHSTMGPLDLFLVPVAADPETVTYEAVFG
jgi:hypothetical protein